MLPWFSDKKSPEKDPRQVAAEIENHPDLKLFKLVELSDVHQVQILELNKKYFLIEKKRNKKFPVQQISDKKTLQLIKQNKLTRQALLDYLKQHPSAELPAETTVTPAKATRANTPKTRSETTRKPKIDYLVDDRTPQASATPAFESPLPPPRQLYSRLQGAMAEFAENNPDAADALNRMGNTASPFQAYFDSVPAGGGGTAKPRKPQPLPLPEEAPAPGIFSAHAQSSTRPAVSHSLDKVIHKQRERLVEVQLMKQKVENEKKRLDAVLERKKYLEAKIIEIEERIDRFQQDFFRMHLTEEDLLRKTAFDLEKIQQELNQLLTDGSVLKAVLDDNAQYSAQIASGPFKHVENLIHSLNLVVQQRRMVNHLLQQREHALLEQQRVKVLLQRKNELDMAIQELQQIIFQIDQTNQNMMSMDPFCVPEPVPVVALNELARLEFELQNILGDPGVQEEINNQMRISPKVY